MKFQVTLNVAVRINALMMLILNIKQIPPASFRAHLIVSVGLPHAGLLHVPSSLLELHAAKDPVAGVTAAHATPAPPALWSQMNKDPYQNALKILINPGCAPDLRVPQKRNFRSGSPRTVTCAP